MKKKLIIFYGVLSFIIAIVALLTWIWWGDADVSVDELGLSDW